MDNFALTHSPLTNQMLFYSGGSQETPPTHVSASDVLAIVQGTGTDSDDTVISQVLTGEVNAFAILVERYKTSVYSICYRLLSDPAAEDAAQEVFVRAYNQLATFQREGRFLTWLFAIATHHCIDLLWCKHL